MTDVTILEPELLLPTADPGSLQQGVAIAIESDRIAGIDSPETLRQRWPTARLEDLPGCMVMPGFVNAHQHGRGISQIQLGYPDDILELWINNRRARGALDAYPITKLAAACMLEMGVSTTVHANYTYGSGDYEAEVRASLRAYDEAGIRVTMCIGAMDRGLVVYPPHEERFMAGLPDELRRWLDVSPAKLYAGDGPATVALMERLMADYADHPRIRFCYGPAGLQWVSDELLQFIARDAEAKGLGLHMHAIESRAQQAVTRELYPQGAFAHIAGLGALGPRTVLAHGVYLEDSDIESIARHQAIVVRNPGSNLRVKNGAAPLEKFLEKGVRVAIGTDNTGLADDEDLLSELRLASLLARAPDWQGPPAPSSADLLAMLTVNGAAAAQWDSEVGTLAVGAKADLVALSLARAREPYLDPDMDLIDAMLERARGADVYLTMVDGRVLYREGTLTGLEKRALEHEAAAAARAARGPGDDKALERTAALRRYLEAHYREVTAEP